MLIPRRIRPFPTRRWLKTSLANAQHELANARTDVKIMDAYRVRDAKRIAFLEAQVRTQAQTVAEVDAGRALLQRLVTTLWASRRQLQAQVEQDNAERFDLL